MLAEAIGETIIAQKVGRGYDSEKLFHAMAEDDERCDNCGFFLCRCVDDSIKPEDRDENYCHV